MQRVRGIGGVFFKSNNPDELKAWYRKHLGLDIQEWGGTTFQSAGNEFTVWSIVPASTEYFSPGSANFMVNYRVDDVAALIELLRSEGCQVDDRIESSDFGKFGWVVDPEGNRIELWEPPTE